MSEACDRYETLISTWMDDEIERPEAVEMFDHLTRCHRCRCFYRDARALEGIVGAGSATAPSAQPEPARAVAGDELWERIEERVRPAAQRRTRDWLLRAAALAVVGLALAFLVAPRLDLAGSAAFRSPAGSEIRVELGSRQGEMTEDRFLEIATEVLEAEPRYQRAMLRVMDTVMRDRAITEGGGDSPRPREERERTEENTGGRA